MPLNPRNFISAMSDGKNRVILLIIFFVVTFVIFFSVYQLKEKSQGLGANVKVAGAPALESIPGVGSPTREYVKLQREQNVNEAIKAKKRGVSAVPTIIQAGFLGEDGFGQDSAFLKSSTSDVCSVKSLKRAKKAGVSAFELRCRGCSAQALRQAGYTAGELRDAGFSAQALKAAGFNAAELKAAGFSAAELKAAGFSAAELRNAGFMKQELEEAGFTESDLDTSICNVEKIRKARKKGVSASAFKRHGCSAAALRAAGYSVDQLKKAGFTAAELKAAGFTAGELKAAGFTASELKKAGFTAEALRQAGFSPEELKAAGFSKAAIDGVCDVQALKRARQRGETATALKNKGCSAAALRAAGFTPRELKVAGFSAAELKAAGFTANELKKAGFSAAELKAAGFTAKELKSAGFTAEELKNAGFSRNELRKAGIHDMDGACTLGAVKKARENGVSAADLRARGCGAAVLREAGFTAGELKDAGFSAKELKEAGFNAADLKEAGFSAKELREAGFSAAELHDAGFTAKELKDAGFSAGELKRAGFSAEDLKSAGFTAEALRKAGYTAAELKEAGFSPEELLKAGYSKGELLRAGISDKEVNAALGIDTSLSNPSQSSSDRSKGSDSDKFLADAQLRSNISSSKSSVNKALERLERRQASQISKREREQKLRTLQEGMASQAGDLISSWAPPAIQQYVEGVEVKEVAVAVEKGQTNNQLGNSQGGLTHKGTAEQPGSIIIKAGDISFATLDTGINSDENSPIMATILQGKLKGARILGTFERRNTKVVLKFNIMNIPKLNHSISIDAVAISAKTARTAIADHVNKHSLLRYGSLFASSFLSGLAEAISKSGTTSDFSEFGVSVTQENLSDLKLALAALGNVGTQYAAVLGNNFTTPPTVKVNSGAGIGILFMKDLTIPANG